ncbi:MAG: hypothetical protein QF682_12025 [Candidatus Thermoplasmatota archaeon]|jgi:hypothetical protein|nr:hypothetical protein [Candidatus Thermoplasmatota archaeon]
MSGMNQLKVAMLFGMFMVLLGGVGALVGQFLFGGSWIGSSRHRTQPIPSDNFRDVISKKAIFK